MNSLKKFFFASAALLMISLAACFGGGSNSTADSGLTQAQVQAMIAAAVTPVNGQVSQLRIVAFRPVTASARTQGITLPGQPRTAATAASTAAGVIIAYSPFSQDQLETLQTTLGNYYQANRTTGTVQNLPSLFFTTTDCSGTPYLTIGPNTGDSLPEGTGNAGHIFAYAGLVWMLPANSTAATQNIQSNFNGGICSPASFPTVTFYTAVANTDPQVPSAVLGALAEAAPH